MKNTWERGVSQVRLFDPGKALGSAAYMTKGKFSAYWAQGANAYEVRKFGQVSEDSIYVSRRAKERMLQQRLETDDRAHSPQAA
jgi:L-amino acid N-acyltransferase YncA